MGLVDAGWVGLGSQTPCPKVLTFSLTITATNTIMKSISDNNQIIF